MLNVISTTSIYVFCPANHVTGGAELLHQLVDKLNNYGLNAFIVYSERNAKVPADYLNYNIQISDEVPDVNDNIVVVYEGCFEKAFNFSSAQIILWWLSVDNFYYCSTNFLSVRDYLKWKPIYGAKLFVRRIGKLLLKGENIFKTKSINDIIKLDAINCYQSEYAQNFLINKGFARLAPLTDYINAELISEICHLDRKDVILYNPKKGYKLTRRLIKATPDLCWKPLVGMNRQELIETFQSSKLYVDFGYHPGKDRIPREAAINGCCVITGVQGSARIYEDVALPNYYKINQDNSSISQIVFRIKDVLYNYDNQIAKFEFYRGKIKREESEFDYQVRNLFNVKN